MKKILIFLFFIISIFADAQESISDLSNVKIFSGTANYQLAKNVAECLGIEISDAKIGRFKDGEIHIDIKENIRGCDIYLIQPTCPCEKASINDNMMELYLLARACKRSSARSITAVVPYFGYARQDRTNSQQPISASDMAKLIESAGVNHIISMDLHCGQIQGFFRDIPADDLSSSSVFVPYFANKHLKNPVIISPDAGGVYRAKKFREKLLLSGIETNMAIIIKERFEPGVIEKMTLVGEIDGCDVIIIDDICDTAGTLVYAAGELKKRGANKIYACITHPVFSDPAIERIAHSDIDELVVSDTIPSNGNLSKNITQLSISEILASAIRKANDENCQIISLLLDKLKKDL